HRLKRRVVRTDERLVLAGEVVEEGPWRHPCGGGDVVDRDLVEAAFEDHLLRRGDQRTAGLPLLLCPPALRHSLHDRHFCAACNGAFAEIQNAEIRCGSRRGARRGGSPTTRNNSATTRRRCPR